MEVTELVVRVALVVVEVFGPVLAGYVAVDDVDGVAVAVVEVMAVDFAPVAVQNVVEGAAVGVVEPFGNDLAGGFALAALVRVAVGVLGMSAVVCMLVEEVLPRPNFLVDSRYHQRIKRHYRRHGS